MLSLFILERILFDLSIISCIINTGGDTLEEIKYYYTRGN